MQQHRRENQAFAEGWRSEETLWPEEGSLWFMNSQGSDSESEHQRANSKRCRQKYEKWCRFQLRTRSQQKHKDERCLSNKRISCNNCKSKEEELRLVERQKQNNEAFLTALLFLLSCILSPHSSIPNHSSKMANSLGTPVIDTSATPTSSRSSSGIETTTMSSLKYLTLSRDRVQVRCRELRNQQGEHEHMQQSI